MKKLISVKTFDGTIIRIPQNKLQDFNIKQEQIKKMINDGKSMEEITSLIKEGAL